jgi:homoserine kinase type II
MSPQDLTADARAVLARYPAPLGAGPLVALGNHGGFSGASLWRVGDGLCLRAAPTATDPAQLETAHPLMLVARRGGLPFVPTVFAASDGATVVQHAGRCWELMEWMRGRASYQEAQSQLKLQSACTALGRLHQCWAQRDGTQATAPIPAVWRRLRETNALPTDAGAVAPLDPAGPVLERARRVLPHRLQQLPAMLLPYWSRKYARLQPCLCDVWHDHLLFEGDRLTGLVDYAAVKNDHVAVDLARMLGSLVEDDEDSWREGLVAYSRQRPLSEEDETLARVLDVTGTVVGAANWARWLSDPRRTFENRAAAVRRLERLLARIERWK